MPRLVVSPQGRLVFTTSGRLVAVPEKTGGTGTYSWAASEVVGYRAVIGAASGVYGWISAEDI